MNLRSISAAFIAVIFLSGCGTPAGKLPTAAAKIIKEGKAGYYRAGTIARKLKISTATVFVKELRLDAAKMRQEGEALIQDADLLLNVIEGGK